MRVVLALSVVGCLVLATFAEGNHHFVVEEGKPIPVDFAHLQPHQMAGARQARSPCGIGEYCSYTSSVNTDPWTAALYGRSLPSGDKPVAGARKARSPCGIGEYCPYTGSVNTDPWTAALYGRSLPSGDKPVAGARKARSPCGIGEYCPYTSSVNTDPWTAALYGRSLPSAENPAAVEVQPNQATGTRQARSPCGIGEYCPYTSSVNTDPWTAALYGK